MKFTRFPIIINNLGNGKFWKQLGMMVLSTTISLTLTLAVATYMEMKQRAKDRRLSAMMVMSNIESFARTLEKRSERMAPTDSLAAWLLSMPVEELELIPEKELSNLISRATQVATLNHDHSAENVFSNNVETWKNLDKVQFIDNVGQCFSAMNGVEEQFNEWAKEVYESQHDVNINPDNYEGNTIAMKCLNSDKVRTAMAAVHNRRCWLQYAAATLRYYNQSNMKAIGISEQEVMDYTDDREEPIETESTPPDHFKFYTDPFTHDSLTSLRHLDARIEELKAQKNSAE
jgi:hypothetical protein